MKHGDIAWVSVAAAIILYEALCPPGQLMSEAVDRYRRRHPFITNGIIFYIAMHLMRQWPRKIDPLHQFAARVSR